MARVVMENIGINGESVYNDDVDYLKNNYYNTNSYPDLKDTPNSAYEAQRWDAKNLKMAGGNLSISELSVGVSAAGAQEYYRELKTNAIDEACTVLKEGLASVKAELRAGWQGQAELNFEKNLDKAADLTVQALGTISTSIESLIASLVEQWAEQDKQMVDVIE